MKEILEILEKDARLSPKELSEMTGIPEEKVKEIIREMEERGVIRKYKTVINWERIGEEYVYALVDLKIHLERGIGYDAIADRIARFPEVLDVRLVSGDYDLSLLVRGKSMKEVAFFISDKIATLDQVKDTVTHFILKTYKEDGDILYEKEKDKRLAISP
jgi:DNA-binding Lrp family transcriptional regulator